MENPAILKTSLMRMFDGFYHGRRVLVTGHSGFKGTWLALWLHLLGAHVTGFGEQSRCSNSVFRQAKVAELIEEIDGDVSDFDSVLRAMDAVRPSVVVHLAGQAVLQRAVKDPVGTFAVNTLGTVHVAEAARKVGNVDALILVTSDKCYWNDGSGRPYGESDVLGSADIYGASKAAAEIAARPYMLESFRLSATPPVSFEVATARAGNVIGGGDWTRGRLVPDAVRAILSGRKVTLREPSAIRPWQFVLEPLSGYLMLAHRLASSDGRRWRGSWNLGPRQADQVAVEVLVTRLAEQLGRPPNLERGRASICEDRVLRLDAGRAKRELKWSCVLSVDEAVRLTADWYRETENGCPAREVMSEQIVRYGLLASERHLAWASQDRGH